MKRIAPLMLIYGFFLLVQGAEAQWTPVKRLTWNSGSSEYPAIAVDYSGHILVVWEDDTPVFPEIYFRTSTNGGWAWLTSQRITWFSYTSQFPDIAVDSSGNLHVVWATDAPGNFEVYYKRSTNGGSTWLTSRRMTWNDGTSEYPAVAVDSSGYVHVVWNDDTPGNKDIYYKKSTDGGSTWLASQRMTWNDGASEIPSIAVDSLGNIHVLWADETPGNFEVFYTKSTDGGSTWRPRQRLTWNSGSSHVPTIAFGPLSHVHVSWGDFTPGNFEVYYKRSTNGGSTWLPSQRLTWNSGYSIWPAIGADSSGNVHVIWADETPGTREINYKSSTNGGSTWGPIQKFTEYGGSSGPPDIAVDTSGNVYIVWDDNPAGNAEIYYRKYVNEEEASAAVLTLPAFR